MIRSATFSQRRRGFDEGEVRDFLGQVASQVEAAEAECAELRAENERLRADVDRWRTELVQREENPPEISDRAVALFSQAQQVADRLVEEAVQHARDLMSAARAQEREIVQQARESARTSTRETGGRSPGGAVDGRAGHGAGGYDTPVPDIEYVRTFARVAQVQFRSVLEALGEQVDRLGQVPDLSEGRRSYSSGDGYPDGSFDGSLDGSLDGSPDVSWHGGHGRDELDGYSGDYTPEPPDPARR
ncbi:DivIVA domain-containing protein [Actinopolymorpha cephalotaxi]|uniref:Cell wall synthesis protein Wag31 n=1 Tax=Actinopolymorpha cephalotaxi TaxID=504797 RepID=A0A1I2K965_9ACTN|nr:DivIVA domain-containing protein [Actinopolymorpha cephalotaxi]NYH85904.1 cell division initiation protein [Actinopolymorpha cephalotaxi]SFF62730.1 DivIVA domain-containing protein [Actinopolymorpha cephalotaxi]